MNCELCKTRMSDAATGRLSARQRAAFEARTRDCADCRQEFGRVQALLEAINRGVIAQVAAEPSPELMVRIRRKIAAEAAPAGSIWAGWIPATACAAMLIIAAAMWLISARGAGQRSVATTAPANPLPKIATPAAQSPAHTSAVAIGPKEISGVVLVHRVETPRRPRMDHEPEVIVPPGEAKALLQLADVLQSGKFDGGELLTDLNKTDQPIEIKPLVIPPLESSPQADDAGSGSVGNGERKNFVSRVLTQEIAP